MEDTGVKGKLTWAALIPIILKGGPAALDALGIDIGKNGWNPSDFIQNCMDAFSIVGTAVSVYGGHNLKLNRKLRHITDAREIAKDSKISPF